MIADEAQTDRDVEPRGTYDPTDIATDDEIAVDERKTPRSDDDAAWERLCAPIMALIAAGPKTMPTIKKWAERQKPRFPVKLAEECVFWLENRGRAVSFKQWNGAKAYRVAGTADAQELDGGAQPKQSKEDTVAKNWISTEEAAKLVGCGTSNLSFLAKTKAIESRKLGDARTAPREYERASVLAYVKQHGAPKRDPNGKKSIAARVAKQHKPERAATTPPAQRKPAPTASPDRVAPSTRLEDRLRALVVCVEYGYLDRDVAWDKLKELVG